MQSISKQTLEIVFRDQVLQVALFISKRTDKWVVCLHGLQSDATLFNDLFKQSFLDGYSLLSINFVGFGDSSKPDDFSYDIADQAEIIKLVLTKLNVESLHLIGHSLGGMVGALLLKPFGNKVLSFANLEGNLVLADCGDSKDVVKYNETEFEDVGYIRLKENIRQSNQKSAPYRSGWLETIPAKVFYKTSASVIRWSKGEKLLKVFSEASVKRMFMYGSQNASKADIVPEKISKVAIPEAGHFMLLDNPEACYSALEDFISKQ